MVPIAPFPPCDVLTKIDRLGDVAKYWPLPPTSTMLATSLHVFSVTFFGEIANGVVGVVTGAGSLWIVTLAVAAAESTTPMTWPASLMVVVPLVVPVRAHCPVEVTVTRPPLNVRVVGFT